MISANELPFLEAIQAGHLFFYDLQTREVVHFREEIFEAAKLDASGMDLDLTESEQDDAEDAWEILEDNLGRYHAMPPISNLTLTEWEREFEETQGEDWDGFYARKFHAELNDWLDDFDAEDDDHDGDYDDRSTIH